MKDDVIPILKCYDPLIPVILPKVTHQSVMLVCYMISLLFQTCVYAVRNAWDWLIQEARCQDVHLRNAAQYHQVHSLKFILFNSIKT